MRVGGGAVALERRSPRSGGHYLLAYLTSALLAGTASALDWQAGPGFRFAPLNVPSVGRTGFTQMSASQTGIAFTNVLTEERGLTNQIYMSGSGVALGDIDGDGWVDIYLCGLDSPNALYRNLGGWRFQDITAGAGVACADQASTGAALADVDGDGDLDLLVTGWGRGARLFLNDGHGRFREATVEAGLTSQHGSTSMALADIDGDGDLDLYLGNYRTSTLQDEPAVRFRLGLTNGQPVIRMIDGRPVTAEDLNRYSVNPTAMSVVENGEPDVLYRNDGSGHFTPVSWTDGSFLDEDGQPAAAPLDWTLSVMFRDLNGDGAPDLYVCSDNDSPDRIWINDGAGRFRALPRLALRHTSLASMGVDVADLNRDGLDEIFVSDMLMREHAVRQRLMADRRPPPPPGLIENRPQYMRNVLFLNRGDGTYAEIAQYADVAASDWTWMPAFLDVDLDGFEDLLIVTGLERSLRDFDARRTVEAMKAARPLAKREFLELRRIMPKLDTPNFAFRNKGDLTFEDVSATWGFNSRQVSQGLALADLDNDGDLDVVINSLNGPALVYRNESRAPRLAVRLKGQRPNTRGIGARIRVTGGPVPQSQEMISGGRYLSCDDALRVFAAKATPTRSSRRDEARSSQSAIRQPPSAMPASHLPPASTNRLTIEVTWRSGARSVVPGAQPNWIYEVDEARAAANVVGPIVQPGMISAQPFFQDVSELIHHRHVEPGYNDFERQPLLPRRLSQLGPGVSWFDLNGDGWDDLLIGCGRGAELGIYQNDGHGGFSRLALPVLTRALAGEVTTVLATRAATGDATLLLGVSNYSTGSDQTPGVVPFDIGPMGVQSGGPLPGQRSSVGPLALADVAGHGDLDLFVGGRVVPGRYPEPAASRLYRKQRGQFVADAEADRLFERVGLVSGAVFSDLDGDGLPELVLACDWGPVRVFRNQGGRFADATVALGLAPFTGWWNSVTVGDFDEDGRLDLVAGNWGRNCKYQRYAAQPLRVYFGDLDGDGTVELLEAYHDPVLRKFVPWRYWDTIVRAMPFVQEKFSGATAFSQAGVAEILGDRLKQMQELSVTTLDTMVFLNRGDHFEPRPLPLEAQLSPVFAVNVGDFDGDGHDDIFVSQNFFGVDAESSRLDAGRGLWLQGDGHGNFRAVPGQESGVRVYGEQRGAVLSDFDHDGRLDLAVAQNGAETKLYHNVRAKAGLRVRLAGPPGNPDGIGAVVRLRCGERSGPAREIHAGSGYWSQDGVVEVMATPETPSALSVRWPGGKRVTVEVPPGAKEMTVDTAGHARVSR